MKQNKQKITQKESDHESIMGTKQEDLLLVNSSCFLP